MTHVLLGGDRRGLPLSQVAEMFGVKLQTLQRWIQNAGLVPIPDDVDKRIRLLSVSDVQKLRETYHHRLGPTPNNLGIGSKVVEDNEDSPEDTIGSGEGKPSELPYAHNDADLEDLNPGQSDRILSLSRIQASIAEDLFAAAAGMSRAAEDDRKQGNLTAAILTAQAAAEMASQARVAAETAAQTRTAAGLATQQSKESEAAVHHEYEVVEWLRSKVTAIRFACKTLTATLSAQNNLPDEIRDSFLAVHEEAEQNLSKYQSLRKYSEMDTRRTLESLRTFLAAVSGLAPQYPELRSMLDNFVPILGPIWD